VSAGYSRLRVDALAVPRTDVDTLVNVDDVKVVDFPHGSDHSDREILGERGVDVAVERFGEMEFVALARDDARLGPCALLAWPLEVD